MFPEENQEDELELCDKNEYAPLYLKVGPKPPEANKIIQTDLPCLVVFGIFQFISVIITIVALVQGDPDRLSTPYDPDHQPCGSGDRVDYPFIYFPSPTTDALYITVCVKACPSQTLSIGSIDCFKNSMVQSCSADFSPNNALQRFLIYASVPHSGNLCLPQINKYLEAIAPTLTTQAIGIFVSDLKKSSMLITFSGILALAIGYGLIHGARKLPQTSAYAYVVISLLGTIFLSILFFIKYNAMISTQKIDDNQISSSQQQVNNIITNNIIDPIRYQQMGIVFIVLAVMICISGLLKFSKISSSCDLLKVIKSLQWINIFINNIINGYKVDLNGREQYYQIFIQASSKYIEDKPEILFIPVIMFGVCFFYFFIWLMTCINLYSCGTISIQPNTPPFGNFTFNPFMKYLIIYQFVALVWSMIFFSVATDFIVGSACSIWYFTRKQWNSNEIDSTKNITAHCFKQLFKHHIGSVAFGCILITSLKWIRDILLFLEDKRAKLLQNSQESFYSKIDPYMKCFHYCFNRFFIYITENSFIYVFLCKENYWVGAKRVTTLIWKDRKDREKIERMSGFGEIFQALGIICICFLTTMISVLMLQLSYYQENLNSAIAPTLCIMLFSFIIGKYTMGILGAAADSILVVIQLDEELNDGQARSIPKDLEPFFKKSGQSTQQ